MNIENKAVELFYATAEDTDGGVTLIAEALQQARSEGYAEGLHDGEEVAHRIVEKFTALYLEGDFETMGRQLLALMDTQ